MSRETNLRRLLVADFVWLALFSLLFSVGAALQIWPAPPIGGFAGSDWIAGLVFGVVLLAALLVGRGR